MKPGRRRPRQLRQAPRSSTTRMFNVLVLLLAMGTLIGLILLWPGEVKSGFGAGITVDSFAGTVERVDEGICAGFQSQRCETAHVRLDEGPDKGQVVPLQLGSTGLDPDLDPGDGIRLAEAPEPPAGAPPVAGTGWTFYDFQRGTPLAWLLALFVAVVLVFARLRGALSLAGLVASLVLVLVFVVPAILDRKSPLLVALVGSLAIALVTIPLAHGRGPKSLAALLGTAAALMLTAALALLFTDLTHLTGLSSEEAVYLQLGPDQVSLQGLLLAGMVIGALGVLDDVTISQASTVLALRRANPALGARELFSRALVVGRDHVSATVNTLVLAYVGAALPILLLFSAADLGLSDVLNLEVVAKEIVATLVGSIGLVAAVPITTALAAVLAVDAAPSTLPAATHQH